MSVFILSTCTVLAFIVSPGHAVAGEKKFWPVFLRCHRGSSKLFLNATIHLTQEINKYKHTTVSWYLNLYRVTLSNAFVNINNMQASSLAMICNMNYAVHINVSH